MVFEQRDEIASGWLSKEIFEELWGLVRNKHNKP